nr:hypothetical protein [Bacteroidales bacterium]
EQRVNFKEINAKNFSEIKVFVNKLNAKRKEMISELDNNEPDMKKLDAIASEIGDFHAKLKKVNIRHYLEIKDLCNPKQQEKLHMMYRHMLPPKCPMPDINNGRGRGKGNRHRNQNIPNF